jgi:hypothetical protein
MGPRAGATTTVMPKSANAAPRILGGKLSAMMDCAMGCKPPPPAPWMARKHNSTGRVGAAPQNKEARVNSAMQIMKKRLRPMRLESQPLMGKTTALATKYVVSTHVPSS